MSEEAATPGPGGVLRATRESLRYTRQDIADALNLTVRVVEDLETEQWQKFHAAAFARGYVRAYAKLLNLDPDALLRDYEGFRQPDVSVRTPSQRSSVFESKIGGLVEAFQRQPGAVLSGAVAVTVCAIGIVLLLVWPDSEAPAPVAPKIPAALSMPPPMNRGADARATRAISPPPVVDVEPDADPRSIAIPPPTSEPIAAPESVAFEPTPETVPLATSPTSTTRRITSVGDDRLELSFTEDCWVEIKDEAGRNLYSDLSRAGTSLSLVGAGPFNVLLGNGPVVTLAFNGEPVPLARHTRNKVTSIVVGARSSNP